MSAETAPIAVSALSPPAQALRYVIDGEPVSLKDLLAVNDLGGDEVVRLRNLPPGQSIAIGSATLTRVASEAA